MTLTKILAFPAFKNKNSNPYNYLLYSGIDALNVEVSEFSFAACLRLNYDVIHVHWPEVYLNSHYFIKALFYSALLLICLGIARLCGKKIIWTVHNLKPHQIKYKKLNALFWPVFLRLVDGIISLSQSNETRLFHNVKIAKKLPSITVYHGLYKGFYPDNVTKAKARQQLSIEADNQVSLFIGQIKPYKNIEHLIELFNNATQLKGHILIIAGKFESDEYFHKITAKALNNPNIIIHNRFIPEDELQIYFRASDLCILPFNNIFNSGSVLLSVSFDTPVLVPENANFCEYAAILDKGAIYTFKGDLKPEDILQRYKMNSEISKNAYVIPEAISWRHLQTRMANFYNQIINE